MTEGEYQVLQALARDRRETVSSLIRRLVRVYRLLHPDPVADRETPLPVEVGPQVFG
jgi:hypothetical protein